MRSRSPSVVLARAPFAAAVFAAIVSLLVVCVLAAPALGMRKLAPEVGYVITSGDEYGPAFEYGVSLIEGTGKFGWGFTFLGHSNSTFCEISTKDGTYRHKDNLSDHRLTLLGIWIIGDPDAGPFLVAGLGPQIHFLKGIRTHIDQGYSESVRETRLGIGALARYERPLPALGRTTFVITASLSWMESSSPTFDPYQLPTEAVTAGAITVGLAFPF
jgi:hypothetical protein